MTWSTGKPEFRRLATFVAAGALNTVVCYALFAALVELAGWHHDAALAADYAAGIALGFALQRVATFADRRPLARTFPKYLAVYLAVFAANLAALDTLIRATRCDPLLAQAICLAIVTLASYTLQKRWVFRAHGDDCPAARAPAESGATCRTGEIEYSV